MLFIDVPGLMCEDLIELTYIPEFRVDFFETVLDPAQVPSVQDKLLFLNFEEIITIVTAHRHYRKIVPMRDWKETRDVH